MPQLPAEDPAHLIIVIPSSLQMGWTKSPVSFCAASETAQELIQTPVGSLAKHPLKHHMLPHNSYLTNLQNPSFHSNSWNEEDLVPQMHTKLSEFIADNKGSLDKFLEVYIMISLE